MNFQEFLKFKRATRDPICVDRTYVKIAGDLVAGVLLSQIMYWHEPDKHGKSKLRVKHEGHMWIAKRRAEWEEECCISPKQYDRAISVLEEKKLVFTDTTMFAGKPSKIVRINETEFMAAYHAEISRGEERSLPLGNNEIDQRGSSITENTTETTANTVSVETSEEMFDNLKSASSTPSEKTSPLAPSTPEEQYLFERINATRAALGRSASTRFATIEQRDKFRGAAKYFNGSTTEQIDSILAGGYYDLKSIVNILAGRMKRPKRDYTQENPYQILKD